MITQKKKKKIATRAFTSVVLIGDVSCSVFLLEVDCFLFMPLQSHVFWGFCFFARNSFSGFFFFFFGFQAANVLLDQHFRPVVCDFG